MQFQVKSQPHQNDVFEMLDNMEKVLSNLRGGFDDLEGMMNNGDDVLDDMESDSDTANGVYEDSEELLDEIRGFLAILKEDLKGLK